MFLPTTTPEAELERLNPREQRYMIGQFFTPAPIAELMADAVRESEPATVLDPGVGGGVLLRAIGDGPRLFGLDIDTAAAELAAESMGGEHEIVEGDFLDAECWPLTEATFDAVIANPPYVRHHNLSAEHKLLARHYSARFGLKVSSLSGSYVYFFLETLLRLNEGGRLVFITPTEFLDVRYGQAVKEALLTHCEIDEILVLEMDELAFEDILTTSAITDRDKARVSIPTLPARGGHAQRLGSERPRGRDVGGGCARGCTLDATAAVPRRAYRPPSRRTHRQTWRLLPSSARDRNGR